jgi:hypothetical protein
MTKFLKGSHLASVASAALTLVALPACIRAVRPGG